MELHTLSGCCSFLTRFFTVNIPPCDTGEDVESKHIHKKWKLIEEEE